MKLKRVQKFLLFEAYRRNQIPDTHEQAKPLGLRWLGLGTASAYREVLDAGLMTWAASVPQKRCMGWLRLTEKGIEVFKDHEAEFKEIMDRMNNSGYQKTLHAQYHMAGGIVTKGGGEYGF